MLASRGRRWIVVLVAIILIVVIYTYSSGLGHKKTQVDFQVLSGNLEAPILSEKEQQIADTAKHPKGIQRKQIVDDAIAAELAVQEKKEVVELNKDTFDNFIKTNEFSLVYVYSPYCGHCIAFKPTFDKLVSEVHQKLAAITIGKSK